MVRVSHFVIKTTFDTAWSMERGGMVREGGCVFVCECVCVCVLYYFGVRALKREKRSNG